MLTDREQELLAGIALVRLEDEEEGRERWLCPTTTRSPTPRGCGKPAAWTAAGTGRTSSTARATRRWKRSASTA